MTKYLDTDNHTMAFTSFTLVDRTIVCRINWRHYGVDFAEGTRKLRTHKSIYTHEAN